MHTFGFQIHKLKFCFFFEEGHRPETSFVSISFFPNKDLIFNFSNTLLVVILLILADTIFSSANISEETKILKIFHVE